MSKCMASDFSHLFGVHGGGGEGVEENTKGNVLPKYAKYKEETSIALYTVKNPFMVYFRIQELTLQA